MNLEKQEQGSNDHMKKKIDWVFTDSFDFEDVNIQGNRITTCVGANIFLAGQIKGQFDVGVQFQQIYGYDGIGIAKAKNRHLRIWEKDYVLFDSQGQVHQQKKYINQVKGFRPGDFVRVRGNVETGMLEWLINDKVVISHICKQFSEKQQDAEQKWAPYIGLWKNSKVKVVWNFPDINFAPIYLALEWFQWDDDILYQLNQILSYKSHTLY